MSENEKMKHTLTDARLAANRANAQKSTGPKTPAGKTRSAANAVKHGFAGSKFAVVRLEDLDEIDKLKEDLVATYKPINSQEMFAIERMALAQNSIFRAYRLESGLFTSALNEAFGVRGDTVLVTMTPDMIGATTGKPDVELKEITRAQNRNFGMGTGFQQAVQKGDTWPLYLRYQAQAERNLRRAKEDLLQLRSMRDELEIEREIVEQPPAEPEPLCAPWELNPDAFPHPNKPLPNEPMCSEIIETKLVTLSSPAAESPRRKAEG
jgi:hypothetical protein